MVCGEGVMCMGDESGSVMWWGGCGVGVVGCWVGGSVRPKGVSVECGGCGGTCVEASVGRYGVGMWCAAEGFEGGLWWV